MRRESTMIKSIIKNTIVKSFNALGYGCEIYKYNLTLLDDKIAINIGAGDWECPGWINLDYPSEWYSSVQKKHKFLPYDIRNDTLPFEDNSVDKIYCSHVIEHIENEYVQKMLKESYRVLARGGILRIACPDAEFLYEMTKSGKEYWNWRKFTFDQIKLPFDKVRPVDCLVQEIAAPKLLGYGYLADLDYQDEFESMEMIPFLDFITSGLKYNVEHVGDHINYWTFDKLKIFLKHVGFYTIVRSKYLGSYRFEMQNRRYFDLTHPQMSLYVEAMK